MDSKWVPFEVGYGFEKVELGMCLLEDVANEPDLPEYFSVTKHLVKGIDSLNEYIADISKQQKNRLIQEGKIRRWNNDFHSLKNYMKTYL